MMKKRCFSNQSAEVVVPEAGSLGASMIDDAEIRALPTRCELVALEQGGSWAAPPVGMSGEEKPRPGRKVVARYSNGDGQFVADIVHFDVRADAIAQRDWRIDAHPARETASA
jgi:hypothetical protein